MSKKIIGRILLVCTAVAVASVAIISIRLQHARTTKYSVTTIMAADVIDGTPMVIVSARPPKGRVGYYYSFQFLVAGAKQPTWELGKMWRGDEIAQTVAPLGLIFDNSGHLYGIPSQEGTFAIVVLAKDKFGNSIQQPFSIEVASGDRKGR